MTRLKCSTPFIVLIIALAGFFLIENGISLGKKPDKVTETKVEQTDQVEQDTFNSITPQLKIWYGKINANETKQLELSVLFPYEGKFFIEATALAYEKRPFAYDKQPKVWKTLGQYLGYVTVKQGEDGKLERTKTWPKIPPEIVKAEGPVRANPWESAKKDTVLDKSGDVKPRVIPSNPMGPMPLRMAVQTGEPLIDLLFSFKPNPKVNEPTKLLLSLSSTVPRDSVVVQLLFPDSIQVLK